jgi:mRNA-degrading endonuclease RelE of RelBE toxin-antitoxin system
MPDDYEVELSETAEKTYSRLYEEAQNCVEAGDDSNAKVKLFRMVDELVTKIIPHNPLDPSRALSGRLWNIFRVKKGWLRICYVASSAARKIAILYISESPRKAGEMVS